jgi:competence protein ComEA
VRCTEQPHKEKPIMTASHLDRLRRGATAALFALALSPALGAQAQGAPPAPGRPGTADHARPPAAAPVEGVLNLNTATLDELTRLPSVGASRAQAILELRQKLGGFKKLDDLMRVKGIGRKTFRRLEPLLRLDGKTTLVQVARPHGTR